MTAYTITFLAHNAGETFEGKSHSATFDCFQAAYAAYCAFLYTGFLVTVVDHWGADCLAFFTQYAINDAKIPGKLPVTTVPGGIPKTQVELDKEAHEAALQVAHVHMGASWRMMAK